MAELPFDKQLLLDSYHNPAFAFAYGSAVMPQKGVKPGRIDLTFGVHKPREFHRLNLETHPDDFTVREKKKGLDWIMKQQNKGAKILYFFAKYLGFDIKYGVVAIDHIKPDLLDSVYLYVAGRLLKPVEIIQPNTSLVLPMRTNLENAVTLALATLPDTFTRIDFLRKVAGFSYYGDTLRRIGSNVPQKINRAIQGGFDKYWDLYEGILEASGLVRQVDKETYNNLLQDVKTPEEIWSLLPLRVREKRSFFEHDPEFLLRFPQLIESSLRSIVRRSSTAQTIKGVNTIGVAASVKYAGSKIVKGSKMALESLIERIMSLKRRYFNSN
jgi:mitochondrial translocator assembly and maintenance protein 41